MIQFDRVSKRYEGGFEALTDVSFQLAPGEMIFLTGHSGAGKSTLMKLIALLERASRGHVIIDGRNLAGVQRRGIPAHRRKVGVIFQDHKLLHDRTVFDNVALPLVVAGVAHTELRRRVRAALDKVGLLERERAYRSHCPAASNSASVSRARSSTNRRCSSPTSRPAIWIPHCRSRSCSCSRCSTRSA